MTEKQEKNATNNNSDVRKITINAQYVKDLSFENPAAPGGLSNEPERPKIDISVDVKVQKLQGSLYEVSLLFNARAKGVKADLFLVELAYAGVFTVEVPAQDLEPVLMIYCPNLLFPFARRIIADVTRDGGIPPLMIDPIDFAALYHMQKQRAQAANSSSDSSSASGSEDSEPKKAKKGKK